MEIFNSELGVLAAVLTAVAGLLAVLYKSKSNRRSEKEHKFLIEKNQAEKECLKVYIADALWYSDSEEEGGRIAVFELQITNQASLPISIEGLELELQLSNGSRSTTLGLQVMERHQRISSLVTKAVFPFRLKRFDAKRFKVAFRIPLWALSKGLVERYRLRALTGSGECFFADVFHLIEGRAE